MATRTYNSFATGWADKPKEVPSYLTPLIEALLEHGGESVCWWNGNNGEAVARILSQGGISSRRVVVRRMQAHRCHDNAFRLVWENPETYALGTGYALTGGMWRPHSWAVRKSTGRLVETTVKSDKYFGVEGLAAAKVHFMEMAADGVPCAERLLRELAAYEAAEIVKLAN